MQRLVTFLVLAALAVAGCGGGEEAGPAATTGPEADEDRPVVVATTGILADVTRRVAGDAVEVRQLVPDSASAHGYSPSARDRAALGEADALVVVGGGYEESLPLGGIDAPVFELTEHVGALLEGGNDHGHEEDDHGHGEEDDHGHEEDDHGEEEGREGGDERDPHVWMDPVRVARVLPALAQELGKLDPGAADRIREGARAHAAELRAVDGEVRELLAGVPQARRKLVVSHDSLGYFANRYDLEVVATPFGLSPEAEASAGRIAEVVRTIRKEEVPAVFTLAGDDPRLMRRIAREADVPLVEGLLVENLGDEARSLADLLRFDARRIAEALG
jgi:ABC-type Zn uptake system ZnuABC Zn-binding protein ZnuA